MDGFTLTILLALIFWAGWFGHWIASRKQCQQLKRYKGLFAELGDVIPIRASRKPEKKQRNGQ